MPLKLNKLERLRKSRAVRRAHNQRVLEHLLPLQIKELRRQRGLKQTELAEAMGKGPHNNSISRYEQPYQNFSVKTLLDFAEALDVALEIKFVPWSAYLEKSEDMSAEALAAESFENEFLSEKAVRAQRKQQDRQGKSGASKRASTPRSSKA